MHNLMRKKKAHQVVLCIARIVSRVVDPSSVTEFCTAHPRSHKYNVHLPVDDGTQMSKISSYTLLDKILSYTYGRMTWLGVSPPIWTRCVPLLLRWSNVPKLSTLRVLPLTWTRMLSPASYSIPNAHIPMSSFTTVPAGTFSSLSCGWKGQFGCILFDSSIDRKEARRMPLGPRYCTTSVASFGVNSENDLMGSPFPKFGY